MTELMGDSGAQFDVFRVGDRRRDNEVTFMSEIL